MANARRILRLQQLILETAATCVQRELRDPRIGLVSITRVKLASDLSTAAIGWSIIGRDGERRNTERGLQNAAPAVQRAIARALHTRVTPRIHFRYDESMDRAQHLEEIFEQLRDEKLAHGDPVDPDAESPAAEGSEIPDGGEG